IVIVAGDCHRSAADTYRSLLLAAFRGFHGTILAGGTEAGVSGLVGELQQADPDSIYSVGYAPGRLPKDVQLSVHYREQRPTSGEDFSPLEPLAYWGDVLVSGVPVARVKLLAAGGGRITASECQMALALGVPVGVVDAAKSLANQWLTEAP